MYEVTCYSYRNETRLKGQVSEDGTIPNDQECTVKNCISNVAGKKKYCDISLVCKMKTE